MKEFAGERGSDAHEERCDGKERIGDTTKVLKVTIASKGGVKFHGYLISTFA